MTSTWHHSKPAGMLYGSAFTSSMVLVSISPGSSGSSPRFFIGWVSQNLPFPFHSTTTTARGSQGDSREMTTAPIGSDCGWRRGSRHGQVVERTSASNSEKKVGLHSLHSACGKRTRESERGAHSVKQVHVLCKADEEPHRSSQKCLRVVADSVARSRSKVGFECSCAPFST